MTDPQPRPAVPGGPLLRRSFRVAGRLTDSLLMSILRDEWEAAAAAEG